MQLSLASIAFVLCFFFIASPAAVEASKSAQELLIEEIEAIDAAMDCVICSIESANGQIAALKAAHGGFYIPGQVMNRIHYLEAQTSQLGAQLMQLQQQRNGVQERLNAFD